MLASSSSLLSSHAQQPRRPLVVRSVEGENKPDANLEQAIRRSLKLPEQNRHRLFYRYGHVDLDNDGIDEVLVHLVGPDVCGSGGCSTLIFLRRGSNYRLICEIGLSRAPIMVGKSTSHSWRDLIVYVAGGGIQPGYYAVLSFDGAKYPGNPTVPPARPLRKREPCVAYLTGKHSFRLAGR